MSVTIGTGLGAVDRSTAAVIEPPGQTVSGNAIHRIGNGLGTAGKCRYKMNDNKEHEEMGTVIQFPRRVATSTPSTPPLSAASPAEILATNLMDMLITDSETGEFVRWGGTYKFTETGEIHSGDTAYALLFRYFELLGISLDGLTQGEDVNALYLGAQEYAHAALLLVNEPRKFKQYFDDTSPSWRAYVYAVVKGDVDTTKQYADKNNLRESFVTTGRAHLPRRGQELAHKD